MADAAELLDQVKGDMRLVRIDGAANGGEIVRHADREYFVPQRLDGVAHIELGLAQLALLLAEILQLASGQQLLVRQHDDAKFLCRCLLFRSHNGSLGEFVMRSIVVRDTRRTRSLMVAFVDRVWRKSSALARWISWRST